MVSFRTTFTRNPLFLSIALSIGRERRNAVCVKEDHLHRRSTDCVNSPTSLRDGKTNPASRL